MSDSNLQSSKQSSDSLIRQHLISGSAQHFRGTMERLTYREWRSSDETKLIFFEERRTKRELVAVEPARSPAGTAHAIYATSREHYREVDLTPITRTTWVVMTAGKDSRYGGIEAYEQPDGVTTLLEFIDGAYPQHWINSERVIGKPFIEFAEYVIQQHGMMSGAVILEDEYASANYGHNRAGAESDVLYDEAYTKIILKEMTPVEARGWFFAKSGIEKPDRQAKKNFSEAMRRRRNRDKDSKK